MIEQGGRGGVADYTAELTACSGGSRVGSSTLATADDHRFAPVPGVTVHRVFHYVRGGSRARRASLAARGLGRAVNGLRFLQRSRV